MTSYTVDVADDELSPSEIFWRDHYDFFRNRGYTLRRRYEPDWTPSWIDGSKLKRLCEDSVTPRRSFVMDATRDDGTFVMLKKLETTSPFTAHEIAVGKLFSSPELSGDPRNHCPLLDVIPPTEGSPYTFIVMPLLYFTNLVSFETVGEVVEYTRQIFEGLQFMHQSNVSHADFKCDNIMANLMHSFQHPPHPFKPIMRRDYLGYLTEVSISRTSRPVKHYIIDFGLSKIYREGEPRLMIPPWGGDRTVPEHLAPDAPPCNPFLVDVYCAGNIIRQEFLDGNPAIHSPPMQGLEFMRELISISDMTIETPEKRPSMDDVLVRFTAIVNGLSPWTLRSPLLPVGAKLGLFSWVAHWTKQIMYYLLRVPPIPTP